MKSNSWSIVQPGAELKVKGTGSKKIYWCVSDDGFYGISFRINFIMSDLTTHYDLNGIYTEKRLINDREHSELVLFVKDNSEWELFNSLCYDLIYLASEISVDSLMIEEVESRLHKWERFLKENKKRLMGLEVQMGLFSELMFLQDFIIKKSGVAGSVDKWKGPQGDKQDFDIDGELIEVKSHRTTKGNKIWISSVDQLEGSNIYLVVYSISVSEKGKSISDLVEELSNNYFLNSRTEYNKFREKLIEGEFLLEHYDIEFKKFNVDSVCFYKVESDFPRITTRDVSPLIGDVKYSINLSYCDNYKIKFEDIK